MPQPAEIPDITVFTPTYQRADTLPRVYESLVAQTSRDFEWLIIDDGSTDETVDLVRRWISDDPPFAIRYVYQENRGKHVADNRAVAEARTELIATLDSDDRYLPQTIASFLEIWRGIPERERSSFSGAVALCALENGTIVGDPFPEDVLDIGRSQIRH
jgi:glycosyltransferase involved in cell wall biosynthesis